MEELIKIRKSTKTGNPIVNARDLYEFLEVGKDFSNWLKGKIKKYGFVENVDYARIFFDINGKKISFAQNGESDNQIFERVYRIEYALTLDCAKELSMVQNNEKGRQARLYFIEVEKKYKALKEKPVISFDMSEVARTLNLSDYYGKIGRNDLLNILRHRKIINKYHQPFSKYLKKGYFTIKPVRVTEEGMKWLNQMLCIEKINNNAELEAKINDLNEKQELLVTGVRCIVETMLYNKGGNRTEEHNRLAVSHLQKFLEETKPQGELNK